MAEKSTANKNTQTKATPQNSWGEALQRLNNIIGAYSNLPQSAFYNAFSRAMANFAPVQHSRTLGINPLPCDYTKDDLGVFLRNPIGGENALQQVGAGLRWSAYPFNKLVLTYATIPTFKNYIMPKYLDKNTVNSESFKREWRLVEKFRKALNIPAFGRKVTAQAMTYGKVFYVLRTEIDKSHNSVKYAFWQQLPQKYCLIEGFNSVSGYTVAFDAFDVFVEYTSIAGKKGFIGIEVKYSETLNEGANTVDDILNKQFCEEPRTRRDRYRELSKGLFAETSFGKLEQLPAFQIWRDHLLAVSMCKAFTERYDEGLFLFLAPYSNKNCRDGVEKYKKLLLNPDAGIDTHFCYAWLEKYIETLDKVFDEDWTKDMKKRYLGIEL